jgi:twitching motility protein PilT
MINNEDLLPLHATNGKAAVAHDDDLLDAFSATERETDESVAMLLAARAEAEEAERLYKKNPETPLTFLKDDELKAKSIPPAATVPLGGYTRAGIADDDDSPAPISAVAGAAARLSDATATESSVYDDFLHTQKAPVAHRMQSDLLGAIGINTVQGGDGSQMAEDRIKTLTESHINELLTAAVEAGASDLHLSVNLPPMIRKDGRLVPLPYVVATERDTQRIVFDILTGEQIEKFERTHELDFSYGVKGVGRFRFNVYRQRSSVGCAMRSIPNTIPTMEQLRLPPVLRDFTRKHSGLVLVTGPTGSGKSTTIASLIDVINTERDCHILTIEDPIEYLHSHKSAMVNQRELGTDTDSFHNSLRAALREDPDVILVGEMRDLETISAAITLAETGHLVFATLHTRSAPATIDRIVDVFPAYQQEQIRIQLASCIEGVCAQQLMPKLGGGRVLAVEIMVATSAIRNLIREGKTYQIPSILETGHQYGMQTMDKVLADLHKGGHITFEEGATRSNDRENYQRLVKGF